MLFRSPMPTINTNYTPPPIQATSSINQTHEALSTGSAVNSTDQGAAVLAIAEGMLSQSKGYDQSARNINDGVSMAQVADGALDEEQQLMERMRELATQAANGIYSDNNRAALQTEMSELQDEFRNIAQNTSFNGKQMLAENGTVAIQAGADANSTIAVPTTDLSAQLNSLNFFTMDLSTQQGAGSALAILEQSSELVSGVRAQYGAVQNQLESRVSTVLEQNTNIIEGHSRLIDTDYAATTAQLARQQILESAGIAMQSHANASRTDALQLLGI